MKVKLVNKLHYSGNTYNANDVVEIEDLNVARELISRGATEIVEKVIEKKTDKQIINKEV
jgi:hypothetical protein